MSEHQTERDRWNACRFEPGSAAGHYESYFQRANHPERPLAFWIRYTIFCPKGRPADTLGELWAIWFDGEQDRVTAAKTEVPFESCDFDRARLVAQIGGSTLDHRSLEGVARAESTGGGVASEIAWNLTYDGGGAPLLLLPRGLYDKPLPKAKALVGSPGCAYSGAITVDGTEHAIDGWIGSQNHNWGVQHTDHYAWGQVAGFDGEPDTFLEVSTARIKLGPVWTPFLTLVVLRDGDRTYELNSPGRALRAAGAFPYFDWTFRSRTREVEIEGRIHAPSKHFVGLEYYNPPGGSKTCLNSKIAACEVTVRRPGEPDRVLTSANRAAFEILTDDDAHGVSVVA